MQVKFYLYKRGGGRIFFSHAEEGHKKIEVVLTRECEVLDIVKWGGGAQNVLPCLEGGGGGTCMIILSTMILVDIFYFKPIVQLSNYKEKVALYREKHRNKVRSV